MDAQIFSLWPDEVASLSCFGERPALRRPKESEGRRSHHHLGEVLLVFSCAALHTTQHRQGLHRSHRFHDGVAAKDGSALRRHPVFSIHFSTEESIADDVTILIEEREARGGLCF